MEDEMMDIGGLQPLPNGWWKEIATDNTISPAGKVYNKNGDVIDEYSDEDDR